MLKGCNFMSVEESQQVLQQYRLRTSKGASSNGRTAGMSVHMQQGDA